MKSSVLLFSQPQARAWSICIWRWHFTFISLAPCARKKPVIDDGKRVAMFWASVASRFFTPPGKKACFSNAGGMLLAA